MRFAIWMSIGMLVCAGAHAASLKTDDGLGATSAGASLQTVSLDGQALPGVTAEALLIDPRTDQQLSRPFAVEANWSAAPGRLVLQGQASAAGREDMVADLVIRITGAKLALGTMAADPLLEPTKLLSKLPLVSLRTGADDRLALAVPPDKLAIFDFRERNGAVELRYRMGFTQDARPELKMRAPFTCVLFRTDPRWHFRSAL